MKVILKGEVDNLGLPGDVVDVADGYGRNFLLPRGLAIIATKGAMKEAAALTRARKAREAQTIGQAEAAREALEQRTLRIAARVDERGHLYGSISANDVQRVLKERGHDVERKRIDLKGSIKQIGEYEIPVQVHPQVTATISLEVVDEEGKVTLDGPVVDVDEAAIETAAAEVAEGSETDVDALAEQALEAAKEFEQQQSSEDAEAETEADEATAAEDTAAEDTAAEEPAEQV